MDHGNAEASGRSRDEIALTIPTIDSLTPSTTITAHPHLHPSLCGPGRCVGFSRPLHSAASTSPNDSCPASLPTVVGPVSANLPSTISAWLLTAHVQALVKELTLVLFVQHTCALLQPSAGLEIKRSTRVGLTSTNPRDLAEPEELEAGPLLQLIGTLASIATMSVASPQMQSSVSSGPYDVDTPASSRHQYSQQQPPNSIESSRSQGTATTSYTAQSSKRPSRRPSGNAAQSNPHVPPQTRYPSPTGSYPSGSGTPRDQDMSAATQVSPIAPTATASPNYAHLRREQRTQLEQHGGPPIAPPRTSSNQRSNGQTSTGSVAAYDRTGSTYQTNRPTDNRPSTSRNTNTADSAHRANRGHGATDRERDGSTPTTIAAAARSRRRDPTSSEGPQRAHSIRDPGAQSSPENIQSRSAPHGLMPTAGSTNASRNYGDEGQILNRVVVTDPAVDIVREQERLAEAIPGLEISGNSGVENTTPENAQRRRDYSSSATSSSKKETNFGGYILGKTLGEGEFGKVKLGWRRDGSVQVAVKLIRREALGGNPSRLPKIYREINILRELSHPNIVRLHEMTETDKHIGIVLEYASGGELFDYILLHRYLKDNAARKLFAQLISGVGYLHKKGIVHRDLKLENLLLDRNKNIIITDFGFANTFNPQDQLDEEIEYNLANRDFVKRKGLEHVQADGKRRGDLMQTSCGSPCYAAPELVVTDSLYTGRKVDVWSCGVILVRCSTSLSLKMFTYPRMQYAMLAGYLPFDDDPANPEGDNINLLYKYIVSTPLTFPEYVTPHARDLLRRILVPDPRKRADLFEVARHSWLSDYAHVVSHVTSSTTTVGEIANTVVTSEQHESPLLARSASVREPSKTQTPVVSPVGGLTHPGRIDPNQSAEKVKGPRDPKRRTVQVEYVPPSSQTIRGEVTPRVQSPTSPVSPVDVVAAVPKTRARSGSQGPEVNQRQPSGAPSSTKPLPRDPYTMPDMRSNEAYQTVSPVGRAQQRPVTSQQQMAPPGRPLKEVPRSTSDSTGVFAPVSGPPTARPTTGGSITSTGAGRLPSRGNSYSQPLAPTVAATNAQGRLAQPKNGKQYHISAPMSQEEAQYSDASIGRPSTQAYSTAAPLPGQREGRGHKRSNTFGNVFGRSGSLFGGGRPQAPSEQPAVEKKYPPTSMKNPIAVDSPRLSSESKRSTSFGFGRKSSDLKKNNDMGRQERPRRFSLLPASFSFKSLTGSSREQSTENILPVSERRQSNAAQQGAPSRGPSRPQTMSYGKDSSRSNSYRIDDVGQAVYDGSRDGTRDVAAQQPRRYIVPARSEPQQPQYQYNDSQYITEPGRGPGRTGPSFLGEAMPNESEISLEMNANRGRYPPGFNSYEDEPPRSSMQQGRSARGPAVLQKNNRKFADAYEQEQERGYGAGGQHAGSSGAARRVMDFFRRRGRARAGDDRTTAGNSTLLICPKASHVHRPHLRKGAGQKPPAAGSRVASPE
ncbi:MAG: hypothetical protein Q9170_006505 [Blastenia crenularia]